MAEEDDQDNDSVRNDGVKDSNKVGNDVIGIVSKRGEHEKRV